MPYKIRSISAGKSQSLALLESGEVLGWGGAGSGRYTVDFVDICSSQTSNQGPVYVGQSARFSALSAGYGVSLGVSDRRELLIWGYSPLSMTTGPDNARAISEIPSLVELVEAPDQIAAGHSCFAAIDVFGKLHTWGLNIDGVLGRKTAQINALPGTVDGLPPVKAVALGDNFMIILSSHGEVFAVGNNSAGQLGSGHLRGVAIPSLVNLPISGGQIAVGSTHVLALGSEGILMGWGSNHYGQLGNSQRRYFETPTVLDMPEKIAAVAAGTHFSLALSVTGAVYSWGWNGFGQLGLNDLTSRSTPTQIRGLSNVQAISAGEMFSLAIGKNDLYGWGCNEAGQIGQAAQKQLTPYPFWSVG